MDHAFGISIKRCSLKPHRATVIGQIDTVRGEIDCNARATPLTLLP